MIFQSLSFRLLLGTFLNGGKAYLTRLMLNRPLAMVKNIVGALIAEKWRVRVPQTCSLSVYPRDETNKIKIMILPLLR